MTEEILMAKMETINKRIITSSLLGELIISKKRNELVRILMAMANPIPIISKLF
jgi:hypothetical protein